MVRERPHPLWPIALEILHVVCAKFGVQPTTDQELAGLCRWGLGGCMSAQEGLACLRLLGVGVCVTLSLRVCVRGG